MRAAPGPKFAMVLFATVFVLYCAFVYSGAGQALYEWSKDFAPYSVRQYLGMSKRYLLQYGHVVFLFALLVLSRYMFLSEERTALAGRAMDFCTRYSTAIFLFHFPIMFCLAAVTAYDKTNLVHQIALLSATVAFSLVLGRFCFAIKPWFDRRQAQIMKTTEARFPRSEEIVIPGGALVITRSHSEILNQVKVLAMICVVVGHFSFDRLSTLNIPGFDGAAPRFAVPTFFMISGYFLMMSIDRARLGPVSTVFKRAFSLYYIIVPMLVVTVLLDYFGFRANAALYDYSDYYITEELRRPYTRLEIVAASVSSLLYLNESWWFAALEVQRGHGGMRAFSNDPFWFMCYLIAFSSLMVIWRLVRGGGRIVLLVLWLVVFGLPILLLAPLFFSGALAYLIHKRWEVPDGATS